MTIAGQYVFSPFCRCPIEDSAQILSRTMHVFCSLPGCRPLDESSPRGWQEGKHRLVKHVEKSSDVMTPMAIMAERQRRTLTRLWSNLKYPESIRNTYTEVFRSPNSATPRPRLRSKAGAGSVSRPRGSPLGSTTPAITRPSFGDENRKAD